MIVDAREEVLAGRGVKDPEDVDPLTLASSGFRFRSGNGIFCHLSPYNEKVCQDGFDCRKCMIAAGRGGCR